MCIRQYCPVIEELNLKYLHWQIINLMLLEIPFTLSIRVLIQVELTVTKTLDRIDLNSGLESVRYTNSIVSAKHLRDVVKEFDNFEGFKKMKKRCPNTNQFLLKR